MVIIAHYELISIPSRIFSGFYFSDYVVLLLGHYELMIILFLTKQWMPELHRFAPNVPVVLVGTKLGEEMLNVTLIH